MIEGEPWRTAINMLRQKTLVGLPTDVVQHHALFRQTQNISHARTPLEGGGKGKREKRGSGPVRLLPLCSSSPFPAPEDCGAQKRSYLPFTHLPVSPFCPFPCQAVVYAFTSVCFTAAWAAARRAMGTR